MHVSVVGINHQTTPIIIRERAAISTEKLHDSLLLFRSYVPHGVILSTCNRTEVYTIDMEGHDAREASLNFLKAHIDIPEADLSQYIYVSSDKVAVEHLFRVACGLDSMIIGEFEVLGQVGYALDVAERAKMVNLPLRHIFQSAIRTGRRVREETGLSRNALSVSSVAVDLATRVIGDLRKCKILVLGAGEAGRLVVKAAKERGVSRIVVASRTPERASALAAKLGGIPISLSNLVGELSTTNIVVTCTGAPHRILGNLHVEEAMEKRPELPLVIIDIGVPRNVEPAVRQIKNVFLYNIDELIEISDLNRKQREGEIQTAEEILTGEVDKFISWWQAFESRPVVSALMKKAEEIRSTQLSKTLKKLPPLSDEEQERLDAMTKSIIIKLLKDPIQYLKTNASANRDDVEVISRLFRLNEEKRG